MSIVVWMTHGRRWAGIAAAALPLVFCHLTGGVLEQSGRVIAATIVGNGVIGLVLGWIYAAYGFEFGMLGHPAAHLVTALAG